MLASACDKNADKKAAIPAAPASEVSLSSQWPPEPEIDLRAESAINAFDINNIPLTDKDIGEFPFFMPPQGYKYVTLTLSTLDENISLKESDRTLYPIGRDRLYMAEGKTLKAALYNEKLKKTPERDFLLIHRHYEDAITAAGGIMVYSEKVKMDETYGTLAPEEYQLMPESIRHPRRVYVIHTQNAELWFEIDCGGGAGCLFNITQKSKI